MVAPLQYEIREFRSTSPLTGAALLDIIRDNDLLLHELYEHKTEYPQYDPTRYLTSGPATVVKFRKKIS